MNFQEIKYFKNNLVSSRKNLSPSGLKQSGADSRLLPYIKNFNLWIWLIITLGSVIRLVQYFHDRSLWKDEAMLALNIVSKSFTELLKPLDNNQSAPFGFLVISKLSVIIFGENELALRLFPLLTGLAALILFYYLSGIYLKRGSTLIAVGLFSFAEPLYYYSSEFKPYSSDVFFTVLLLIVFTKVKTKRLNISNMFILSMAGSLVLWFSFPSIFVLTGIGLYILLNFLIEADLKSFFKFIIICTVWLISFGVLYFYSLRDLSQNNFMQEFWNDSFMPLPSFSFGFFSWFIQTFFDTFGYDLIIELSGLAGLLFLLGLIEFYRNNRTVLFTFTLPILITILASMLHKYPFEGRLLLFLTPPLFVLIAAGFERIKTSALNYKRIFIITAILLLFPLFYNSLWNLHKPIEKEEIKNTLTYLKEHIHPNDEIYLYYGAIEAFDYYRNRFIFPDNPIINGIKSRDNWQAYVDDLNKLKGKSRVWILFSHIYKKTNEQTFILTYLKSIGTLKSSFKTTGAETYLFNFQ